MTICRDIQDYIDFVRSSDAVCDEQRLMCDFVEKVLSTEDVYVDEEQLARYMGLQKYFPYPLFEWERFCFAMHNCLYRADGELRFPVLVIVVGRGSGKNGYLAFENFALTTPINGVQYYHIDMFATSEKQAKSTFEDIYNILDSNRDYFKNYYKWNQETITNLKTRSKIEYHTRAPGTKDGGRPGKVDFDEYHAYINKDLIKVAVTGLGKKRHPRRTIITTQGDVRDGPMDSLMDDCLEILNGHNPDNGQLPFICRLDEPSEVDNEKMWHKANPSLRYFPDLLNEMRMEYAEYKRDRLSNPDFMTKRMNWPPRETEFNVTSWDNLMAASKPVPDLKGRSCVAGIDYAKTEDFVVAGLLFKDGDQRYWIYHVWVCTYSKDLDRINKVPLNEAKEAGVLEYVDKVEIPPEYVADWIREQMRLYIVEAIALDDYRYALMREALEGIGYTPEKKRIKLVRPSDKEKVAPIISHVFTSRLLAWGKVGIMRWFTWNTKAVTNPKGNIVYEKIEQRSRKTDGFMAYVAAETIEDRIKQRPKIGRRLGTVC